ncbi:MULTISPECIES: carbohydrate ABC transporter permease [Kosmotoga]|uniref:Binding-protein-dependent transport systems inner membrane component n=1 Tax=Kosmotoga olearia (strain ATCC BAA-1733 / DSM 21960 / TBF 19.5.1) TaxID=521045 RepID=C5CGK0_KOSOT|nr:MULTISPECIES: carbohydrate ABC transporter permease [Kosmotoga]ACR79582.1 binding-protein-dependent transport systems inner membrane component [Kosmotoga olearia TBF 19.5.1]MDI3524442.1 multiple sugar transport system permease protein [Kosmotoga sp.]MDK2954255.1 multiple sugar transport system permease protein [Kosmotoga sp.]OAA22131.1 ABC transporter permease [Kosmotoga sp. DU53]
MIIKRDWRYRLRQTIAYSLLIFLLITTLFPLYIMISTSLKPEGNILPSWDTLIPKEVTFKNYVDVWKSANFNRYFLNSVIVTVSVTILNIILDSIVAYALSRKNFKGANLVLLIILATMMIPAQVLMIPLFILIKKLAMYNTYWALILPFAVQGFGIFLMKQYFDGLPKSLDEAARIDGGGDFTILFRVLFPISRPAIAVLGINTFLTTWNSFLYPLIFTNTDSMRTLPIGIAYFNTLHGIDYVHLMAGSSIATIPVIVVFLAFQKQIISGLVRGAVKE